ncbi:MAG: DUF4907 domain-containing protein [Saprospiraceae bacterium]
MAFANLLLIDIKKNFEFRKRSKDGRWLLSVFAIGCLILTGSCGETNTKGLASKETSDRVIDKVPTGIVVKTFPGENGWGYDILRNGKKYIHQATKPGIAGNKGFNTELQARKVGELVAYKIENGILPPTVMEAEIDSIIYQNKE